MSAEKRGQLDVHACKRWTQSMQGPKERQCSPSSGPNEFVIWIRANKRNDIVMIVMTPKTTDTVVTVGPWDSAICCSKKEMPPRKEKPSQSTSTVLSRREYADGFRYGTKVKESGKNANKDFASSRHHNV